MKILCIGGTMDGTSHYIGNFHEKDIFKFIHLSGIGFDPYNTKPITRVDFQYKIQFYIKTEIQINLINFYILKAIDLTDQQAIEKLTYNYKPKGEN